jgi:FixJ family two-component response regulator
MHLIAIECCTNKEVARKLGISIRTCELHRLSVMEKMGAKNVAHLVHLALAEKCPHDLPCP